MISQNLYAGTTKHLLLYILPSYVSVEEALSSQKFKISAVAKPKASRLRWASGRDLFEAEGKFASADSQLKFTMIYLNRS